MKNQHPPQNSLSKLLGPLHTKTNHKKQLEHTKNSLITQNTTLPSNQQLLEEWVEVVGPSVINFARPIRLQHNILTIRVLNPAWMQELSYMKGRYLQLLNERLGIHIIRQLRFEVGDLPQLPKRQVSPKPAWLQHELPPELIDEIERKLAELPENEYKESARRIMINHYKLTRLHRKKRPRS